ncbi:DNA-binding transcriptional regulator, AcrR family [Flaviramulus basaltis]|uniref:DNA-binding transcriptional regulator, AcrR family n=1 Tax=Flaviramulus basaltis TaxID=369401 RepID=A0A1K2IE00_9FLAO|nr:TetR/AcrR family transcriptional regulator [Flaviramulus basaltis]SFZ90486.1 DNA-binding transcriptional regulator, AcrR family [Flaviramulus basaltis]
MINKKYLLECSVTKFLKFGSKSFTLDELSKDLGISKKTIYKHFKNKKELISNSILFLIDNYTEEYKIAIDKIEDPIEKVIVIYEIGLKYLKYFKPSFLFGLKKYYPKADEIFENFKKETVYEIVYGFLNEAKTKGHIRENVDLRLVCELYFLRMENVTFKNKNLFEEYSLETLLQHLIINNLRGITTQTYSSAYFE